MIKFIKVTPKYNYDYDNIYLNVNHIIDITPHNNHCTIHLTKFNINTINYIDVKENIETILNLINNG